MASESLPPHNIQAEEAVLGSLFVDDTALSRIAPYLSPQDFFRERNRWIYEAALRVAGRGQPTNPLLVAQELAEQNQLELIGHAAYLSQIIAAMPTSVHAEWYAKLVHDLADQRRLIQAGGQIAAMGFNGDKNGLQRAQTILRKLDPTKPARPPKHGPVEV